MIPLQIIGLTYHPIEFNDIFAVRVVHRRVKGFRRHFVDCVDVFPRPPHVRVLPIRWDTRFNTIWWQFNSTAVPKCSNLRSDPSHQLKK